MVIIDIIKLNCYNWKTDSIMFFFAIMTAPLEYVRSELFDEAMDRHHRSYVSAVLRRSPSTIRCRMTRTLMPIHQRWIPKYVIHIYYLFLFLYNSNYVK
jgi:hypothetical protein